MKKIQTLLSGLLLLACASSAHAIPVLLDIEFDNYPGETSFGIWADAANVGASQAAILSGIAYDVAASSDIGFGDGFVVANDFSGESAGPWQFVWDLAVGSYTFGIFDSFGDGLCCNFGTGSYSLSADGLVVAAGTSFGRSEITEFNVIAAPIVDVEPNAVPEPNIIALLALGIMGAGFSRRRSA